MQRLGKTLGFRILLEQTLTHMYTPELKRIHTNVDIDKHCRLSPTCTVYIHIHINVDKDSAILVVNRIFLYYFDGKGVIYHPMPELEIRNNAPDIQYFCKV